MKEARQAGVTKGGPRPVSRPHDRDEREAERAADVVARGGSVAGWSFSSLPATAPARPLQRQEAAPQEKSEDEKRNEALKKAGEAALATPEGKALKEKVLQDPLVKSVTDAVTSTPGLIGAGAGIAGGVAALAATGKELPVQPPDLPLERVSPKLAGVSARLAYEGPVNAPTFVGLTITVKEQGPKGKGAAKPDPIAADIARLRAQEEMFRKGRTYAPGSKEAEEERLLDEAVTNWVLRGSTLPGLTIPLTPAAPAKKTEEQTPAQPAPASPSAAPPAHAQVDDALASPGRPLDPPARRSLEARFGHDFSRVRVHDDARAAATAAALDAAAFTVGEDVVFAPGRYDPGSPEGTRLLAHELAHVVQQRSGAGTRVQREQAAGGATVVPAERADYEEFVDAAVRYLDGARDHYRAVAQAARVAGSPPRGEAPPAPAQEPQAAPQREEAAPQPAAAGGAQQAVPAAPPAAPGLSPERLRTVLEGLLRTYEGSRQIVETQLGGDTTRLDRLRTAYLGAADAARAAATSTGRINLVFIAAPRDATDVFITNATTYARLYFSTPAAGDTVQMQEAIDSPEALFDAIETTAPDQMIRRIDIFCHGTIEPAHQIRFGATWYRTEQIEAAAAARARAGRTLQNQTRFDGSTVIELHACRLGAPAGEPGTSGLPVSSGQDFLQGFGEAVGGARGQETVGYEQRWVPRRFEVNGVRSTADVASGRRARAFDRIALRYYNAVEGSMELQTQLTEAERGGAPLSDARKIEVMRRLYDAGGGAWLIGHQYTTAEPRSADLARDVPRSRDTFTNEADWTHLVLRVRVPAAAGGTP